MTEESKAEELAAAIEIVRRLDDRFQSFLSWLTTVGLATIGFYITVFL